MLQTFTEPRPGGSAVRTVFMSSLQAADVRRKEAKSVLSALIGVYLWLNAFFKSLLN
jgi:hypothetical protein